MVSRRTSTVPGDEPASDPPTGRPASVGVAGGGGARGSSSTGRRHELRDVVAAVSADWRWGRTTRPMGWSVAAVAVDQDGEVTGGDRFHR